MGFKIKILNLTLLNFILGIDYSIFTQAVYNSCLPNSVDLFNRYQVNRAPGKPFHTIYIEKGYFL